VKHPEEPGPTQEAADLIGAAAQLPVYLGLGQAQALISFERLLMDVGVPLGLLAPGDAPRIRERHVLDSLRAVLAVEPSDRDAYDLGSGAGLPGVVIAVARPAVKVGLVEARSRRAGFLELALEQLRLPNAAVLATRADRLRDPVDVCFARALAPLPAAWELSRHLLRPGGRLVYFAGRDSQGPERSLPEASSFRLLRSPVLASSGPLVIMTRQ
jgi:16S rRNA (guanine527-N7)-methyltransferase